MSDQSWRHKKGYIFISMAEILDNLPEQNVTFL